MSILDDMPDHEIIAILSDLFDKVEWEGGWADYAVYCGGDAGTGIEKLDRAVEDLYRAGETMHRIANELRTKYNLEW